MPWAGGIFSSVKSKSFFVDSQKQGGAGAWQKPVQESPWPEASLTLVTQALVIHRFHSLLLQWAAGILSWCWDAVLGNMSCEVPTLHFWSAVGKIFHLGYFISVLLSEHTTNFLGTHLGWKNSLCSAGLPFEWEKPEAASERCLPSLFPSIRPSRSATEPGFLFPFYRMPE